MEEEDKEIPAIKPEKKKRVKVEKAVDPKKKLKKDKP